MTLDEYQIKAASTAAFPNGIPEYMYIVLGLTGETGEVAEKIKKMIRNDNGVMTDEFRDLMKKELGDVLWYLAMLSKTFGYSFDDVAETNIKKLKDRVKRNVIKSQGDTR